MLNLGARNNAKRLLSMLKEEVIAQNGSPELPGSIATPPAHGRARFHERPPREREQLYDRLGSVVRALARRLR
jgi:hypothetical protein